jgi:ATP-dependent Clp protease ATP-binding subunit ClpX
MVKVDTKNILFICGGAFDGVEKVIGRRLNTSVIGFSGNEKKDIQNENLLHYITHQDLKHFGLIPELLGRLPVLTHLNPLDKETLIRILTEPKNALVKQYQRLFELEGVTLTFEPEALDRIAEKSLEFNLGARGLRSICEAVLTDAMFELPSEEDVDELIVDKNYVDAKLTGSTINKLKAA